MPPASGFAFAFAGGFSAAGGAVAGGGAGAGDPATGVTALIAGPKPPPTTVAADPPGDVGGTGFAISALAPSPNSALVPAGMVAGTEGASSFFLPPFLPPAASFFAGGFLAASLPPGLSPFPLGAILTGRAGARGQESEATDSRFRFGKTLSFSAVTAVGGPESFRIIIAVPKTHPGPDAWTGRDASHSLVLIVIVQDVVALARFIRPRGRHRHLLLLLVVVLLLVLVVVIRLLLLVAALHHE